MQIRNTPKLLATIQQHKQQTVCCQETASKLKIQMLLTWGSNTQQSSNFEMIPKMNPDDKNTYVLEMRSLIWKKNYLTDIKSNLGEDE